MRSKRREKRFMVRLTGAEHRALQRLAEERDISASQLIRRAIKRETETVAGESR
jgi:predicted HicB family RNase H-like nuclease